MNLKMFYKELEALNLKWEYMGKFGRIRDRKNWYCPICALAAAKTGKIFNNGAVEEAGKELGLSIENIETVVRAADNNGEDHYMRFNREVREELERICKV